VQLWCMVMECWWMIRISWMSLHWFCHMIFGLWSEWILPLYPIISIFIPLSSTPWGSAFCILCDIPPMLKRVCMIMIDYVWHITPFKIGCETKHPCASKITRLYQMCRCAPARYSGCWKWFASSAPWFDSHIQHWLLAPYFGAEFSIISLVRWTRFPHRGSRCLLVS
jgi:hypothetical protein